MPPTDPENPQNAVLKLTWQTFVNAAMNEIRKQYPNASEPKFLKDYGRYEAIGDMYDFPSFVEIEIGEL
jgi:hypothetical protein